MVSRIFWIALAGIALLAGIAVQERSWLLAWAGDAGHLGIEGATERAIEARVEQAVERSFDRMEVVDSEGRPIEVAPQTKRELGDAVGRLVSAQTELALMRVRGGSDAAERDARSRRDAARADVERLKDEIERQKQLSAPDRDAMREQIRQEIRENIRETVRSAVRS